MRKAKQLMFLVLGSFLVFGSATKVTPARTTRDQAAKPVSISQNSASQTTRSSSHRQRRRIHHRRSRSAKKVPNAASLKKESW